MLETQNSTHSQVVAVLNLLPPWRFPFHAKTSTVHRRPGSAGSRPTGRLWGSWPAPAAQRGRVQVCCHRGLLHLGDGRARDQADTAGYPLGGSFKRYLTGFQLGMCWNRYSSSLRLFCCGAQPIFPFVNHLEEGIYLFCWCVTASLRL